VFTKSDDGIRSHIRDLPDYVSKFGDIHEGKKPRNTGEADDTSTTTPNTRPTDVSKKQSSEKKKSASSRTPPDKNRPGQPTTEGVSKTGSLSNKKETGPYNPTEVEKLHHNTYGVGARHLYCCPKKQKGGEACGGKYVDKKTGETKDRLGRHRGDNLRPSFEELFGVDVSKDPETNLEPFHGYSSEKGRQISSHMVNTEAPFCATLCQVSRQVAN